MDGHELQARIAAGDKDWRQGLETRTGDKDWDANTKRTEKPGHVKTRKK